LTPEDRTVRSHRNRTAKTSFTPQQKPEIMHLLGWYLS